MGHLNHSYVKLPEGIMYHDLATHGVHPLLLWMMLEKPLGLMEHIGE